MGDLYACAPGIVITGGAVPVRHDCSDKLFCQHTLAETGLNMSWVWLPTNSARPCLVAQHARVAAESTKPPPEHTDRAD